jgi:hypothetical protein
MFCWLKSVSRSMGAAIQRDPQVERFGAAHPLLVPIMPGWKADYQGYGMR